MPRRKQTDTIHVSLRMKEDLRRKLEKEAKGSKVSLNSEIIHRLEGSFDSSSKIYDFLGGEHIAKMLVVVSAAIKFVEEEKGNKWNDPDNPDTTIQAIAAVYASLKALLFLGEEDVKQLVRASDDLTGVVGAVLALKASGYSEEQIVRRWETELPEPKSPLARLREKTGDPRAGTILEGIGDEPDPDRNSPPADDAESTPEPKPAPRRKARK